MFQYEKFERQNNLSINVFDIFENAKDFISPIYTTKTGDMYKAINLGLYNDHYVLIKI